jgi:hypothetical protein
MGGTNGSAVQGDGGLPPPGTSDPPCPDSADPSGRDDRPGEGRPSDRLPPPPETEVRAGLAEQLLARRLSGGVSPPPDEAVRSRCPLLWELLTLDTYRDGTQRVLPTLKIERTGGGYVVSLQDHASRSQVTVTCETLAEVPRALERVLGSGKDVWREYDSLKVKDPSKRAKRKSVDGRSSAG